MKDNNELKTVLYGMLDMLGADKKAHNIPALAAQCMEELDTSHDGKVSKSNIFIKILFLIDIFFKNDFN